MIVVFILLSIIVTSFMLMLCLTLFRIERSVKASLIIAERKIVKDYGKKRPDD